MQRMATDPELRSRFRPQQCNLSPQPKARAKPVRESCSFSQTSAAEDDSSSGKSVLTKAHFRLFSSLEG